MHVLSRLCLVILLLQHFNFVLAEEKSGKMMVSAHVVASCHINSLQSSLEWRCSQPPQTSSQLMSSEEFMSPQSEREETSETAKNQIIIVQHIDF